MTKRFPSGAIKVGDMSTWEKLLADVDDHTKAYRDLCAEYKVATNEDMLQKVSEGAKESKISFLEMRILQVLTSKEYSDDVKCMFQFRKMKDKFKKFKISVKSLNETIVTAYESGLVM